MFVSYLTENLVILVLDWQMLDDRIDLNRNISRVNFRLTHEMMHPAFVQ